MFFSLAYILSFAQFVSPGNGTKYTLASLATTAPTVIKVVDSTYEMTADLTISAGDTLEMDEETHLYMHDGVLLTVGGVYRSTAPKLAIVAKDSTKIYRGIRFEGTSDAEIKNTIFSYGGGIQVQTAKFVMDNSAVTFFKSGLVTSAAISFSTGSPIVKNSKFRKNDLPAVASGANQTVALQFMNNELYGNSRSNGNRPQINMGPSGSGITKILNNTIIGDRSLTRVGGVSVSTLLGIENHPHIEGNIIKDNRYGITITGNNSSGVISNNIITDNNTENAPMLGGSGISLSGSSADIMAIKIEKNQIRGNLWGITIINKAQADLGGGALGSVGENVFANNGNGGQTYALFNNTALPISAKNNCWREGEISNDSMVEDVISHRIDDPALGTVDYLPYLCGQTMATDNNVKVSDKIYPNPSDGNFVFEAQNGGNLAVIDQTGKIIFTSKTTKGKNHFHVRAPQGIYVVQHLSEGKISSYKLILK